MNDGSEDQVLPWCKHILVCEDEKHHRLVTRGLFEFDVF